MCTILDDEKALVSIITPVYNSEEFVRAAIVSAQAQTYTNWEMIVVDDFSQDNTYEIVEEIAKKDQRIQLIKLSKSGGPAIARNEALQLANGRFIAFLDSDDLWLPEKLEHQLNFMLDCDIAFSYTRYRRISTSLERTGRLIRIPDSLNYWQLLRNTAIATLTVMVDRQKTGVLETLDEGYDDFILWLSILKRGFVAYGLQEDLARYRCGSRNSVSSNRIRSVRWVWNIYRNVEKLNPIVAFWCFLNYGWNAYQKWSTF